MNEINIFHIIAWSEAEEIKNFLVGGCLIVLLAMCFLPLIVNAYKKLRKMGLAFCLIGCGFLWSMATKPDHGPAFNFDTGLTNTGSWASNTVTHIAWRYSAVIANDTLHIDYRADVEAPWQRLFDGPVNAGSWEGYVAGGTNGSYWVWSEYIPPVVVHTNGVYHLNGVMRTMDPETGDAVDEPRFVTPGIPIIIIPPAEEETATMPSQGSRHWSSINSVPAPQSMEETDEP